MLSTFAVYLLSGIGCSFSMKAGDMNLGGEGQIYTGGFVAGILLLKLTSLPAFIALPVSFFAAGFSAAVITLFSTFLQNKKGINFLLSSFIISSAIIPFLDGLITGPFRTTQGTLLATAFIPKEFHISYIFTVILAIVISIGCWYLIYKTEWGKKLSIFGTAREFSLYIGTDKRKTSVTSSILSGFFHGISGALAVCTYYYACHKGFYMGMGWNALAVAMIGKSNPLFLIPAGFFMALLITAANQYALFNNFNFDISVLIQAVIIFIVAIPVFKNIKWRKK